MSDDDVDAWGSELDGKASPQVGVTRDVMHQARMLNPALAAQGSTTELFNKVKGGHSGSESPAPSAATANAPRVGANNKIDFASGFYQAQQKYKDDRARIQQEIAKLQLALRDTQPKTLERIIDMVIDIDPNMTSPQTQEIFRAEVGFLNEIGFSVRKVIDKKVKKR